MKKFFLYSLFSVLFFSQALCKNESKGQLVDPEASSLDGLIIKKIVIEGSRYVKNEVIENRLPYKVGDSFEIEKSGNTIRNLETLNYFRQIRIEGEQSGDDELILYIVVEEKKLLESLVFKGNKTIKSKELKKKLNLDKLTTIDEEVMQRIARGIKKLYAEENRHLVNVSYTLIPNKKNPDKATAIFTIGDGPKSLVTRVDFTGNENMPARKLRKSIFTRENWILSFLDGAGAYNPEMLEMDKRRIEYFYRDYGYLTVKVPKVETNFSDDKKTISAVFHIKEGNQFIIRKIRVVGDEIYGEDELLPLIVLDEGNPFSQTKLVQSMNKMKDLYGEKGYIYADVYPQVKPNEQTNEVDVTFHVERGNKLYANRIIITGNKITRDKVIRRQFEIVEGDMITTKKLTDSQSGVEYLSFFERDGINWKVHRISDELADLEMNVREAKTGNLNFMMSYGTDQFNPKPTLRGSVKIDKANLFGLGWDVGGMIQADRHRLRKIEAHFFDPHIFDSNVSTALFFYKRWDDYEQWKRVDKTPVQKILGGNVKLGFWLPQIDKRLQLILDLGIEDIKNNNPRALGKTFLEEALFETVVRRTFQEGTLKWFGIDLVKDTRNHQIYPNKGYKVTLSTKTALPAINDEFSFLKSSLEGSFYTALIGEDSLVLGLHGLLGNIRSLTKKKPVPYKELFHIGGQTTVRGFVWGSIGPAWFTGDPLGARNAMVFNAELIFPLIADYSMKGHIFYDAGAGWNTPKHDIPTNIRYGNGFINPLKRDKFDLRHSVGFGINILKPVPAKIDWGFKLDRRKKENESPHEFHLSMNYAW